MKVHSIFESISGEVGPVVPQGAWSTFIRLQGCNLKCGYCDAVSAQKKKDGKEMTIDEILSRVHTRYVVITGGEPFMQEADLFYLVRDLLLTKKVVQIETNGSYAIREYPEWRSVRFGIVMDYKGPSSGQEKKMMAVSAIRSSVQKYKSVLKFVISNEEDAISAVEIANGLVEMGTPNCLFAFSPVDANIEFVSMIKDTVLFLGSERMKSNFSINLQIHKIINFQ